ncbi:hypothetical protein OsI_29566 [Oryza sativa Indica Group]|uniref:Uncharacterized protein n=1 Tax=Oryza sativa subsp. indica TaxID=39946 RepID=A2YW57_ORYSI|nr:hypothetical protein OsI_29566 [Oryza sativa Indica Group]
MPTTSSGGADDELRCGGRGRRRRAPAWRTRPPPMSSGVEDAATGKLQRGAWSHGRRRILRGDRDGAGDELRHGERSRVLRRGRRTRPLVTSSRRRTQSPATSSDMDRGWGRMRLPATRFGFGVDRGRGRTRPPMTTP